MPDRRRLSVWIGPILTLLLACLLTGEQWNASPAGLVGSYYADAHWTPPVVLTRVDAPPSSVALFLARHQTDTSSVIWHGAVVILTAGRYTFATASDDGSTVAIDGTPVVANGGEHERRLATGTITLARGTHRILIQYFDAGGTANFDLFWSQDGAALVRVPAWRLRPRLRPLAGALASIALDVTETVIACLWMSWLIVAMGRPIWRRVRPLARRTFHAWHPSVPWILALSVALNAAGLAWGLPAGWAPDELSPAGVIDGLSQGFSGGWFSRYPPFHYAVLAVAELPIRVLHFLGIVGLETDTGIVLLGLADRAVSVLMAAATIVIIESIGRRIFGRRAGALAAVVLALVLPFIYYARTANVDLPYLFWFALSLCAYIAALETRRRRDYVLLAVFAALAVSTKDQAYGLYILMPIPLAFAEWRARRGRVSPSIASLGTTVVLAMGAGAVVFALGQNLLFDWRGFVSHVRLLAGSASQTYQMFPATVAGHLALAQLTWRLLAASFGWPAFAAAVTGVIVAIASPRWRIAAVWLVVPMLSYDLTFLDVILYNYDRFVLPLCLILSLFAGLALDGLIARAGWIGGALVSMAVAYGALGAVTLDVLTLSDARYGVRRWLDASRSFDDRIAVMQPLENLPRVDDLDAFTVETPADLERVRPRFVVLNLDYAAASAGQPAIDELLDDLMTGRAGLHVAFQARTPNPFTWLPGIASALTGPRRDRLVTSILRDVNPTTIVFERDGHQSPR